MFRSSSQSHFMLSATQRKTALEQLLARRLKKFSLIVSFSEKNWLVLRWTSNLRQSWATTKSMSIMDFSFPSLKNYWFVGRQILRRSKSSWKKWHLHMVRITAARLGKRLCKWRKESVVQTRDRRGSRCVQAYIFFFSATYLTLLSMQKLCGDAATQRLTKLAGYTGTHKVSVECSV